MVVVRLVVAGVSVGVMFRVVELRKRQAGVLGLEAPPPLSP